MAALDETSLRSRRTWAFIVGTLVAAGVAVGLPDRAAACLHPPTTVKSSVEQSEQVVMTYWEGGTQHLWLSAGVETDSKLSRLGWVVPVPNEPNSYGTGEAGLFGALSEWMNLTRHEVQQEKGRGALGGGSRSADALNVGEEVKAGPYTITPLEATGRAGLKALRDWLEHNDFKVPASTEPAKYYVKRGWTFLAVRIDPAKNDADLDLNGRLPPLRLAFESRRVVYPLKFETNQGEFSVTMYVVTPHPMPQGQFDEIREKGFFVAGTRREESMGPIDPESPVEGGWPISMSGRSEYTVDRKQFQRGEAPEVVRGALDDADAWESARSLHVSTVHTDALNGRHAEPDRWEDDFAIPMPESVRTPSPERKAEAVGRMVSWRAAGFERDMGRVKSVYNFAIRRARANQLRLNLNLLVDRAVARAERQARRERQEPWDWTMLIVVGVFVWVTAMAYWVFRSL